MNSMAKISAMLSANIPNTRIHPVCAKFKMTNPNPTINVILSGGSENSLFLYGFILPIEIRIK
jgi:hypothetical protein